MEKCTLKGIRQAKALIETSGGRKTIPGPFFGSPEIDRGYFESRLAVINPKCPTSAKERPKFPLSEKFSPSRPPRAKVSAPHLKKPKEEENKKKSVFTKGKYPSRLPPLLALFATRLPYLLASVPEKREKRERERGGHKHCEKNKI